MDCLFLRGLSILVFLKFSSIILFISPIIASLSRLTKKQQDVQVLLVLINVNKTQNVIRTIAYCADTSKIYSMNNQKHKNSEIGRAGGRYADNIIVIKPNTNWARNSFHYRATLTWNSLDPTIKRATSLSLFSCLYKRLMWT